MQRLLAFARRQPMQSRAVDLADLVHRMAELVASTTGPQVRVSVEVEGDLPPAIGDPNQLEMAILNLAVNARDAMPEGGMLRISATAEIVAPGHPSGAWPGPYVCLSVADTGGGLDATTLARAIEPFFSTKGVGRGTGLGLSMVHGLVGQLGGWLRIQSRPGLGANVELRLPVAPPADEVVRSATLEDGQAPIARKGGALVVDDEVLVRESTADMLRELGYDVVEAASAEEALRVLDDGTAFDLMLTDHLMPGMGGTELARAARIRFPGLQVLIVSGYPEADGISPELPRLTKPFRQADLETKLIDLERG